MTVQKIPYRIDLAGGWFDQPFVSSVFPGSVITISIEPTTEFNERSGMATSTRKTAIELWGNELPDADPQSTAAMLFASDNPPGKAFISGSQDSIGIVYAGLNNLYYDGEYWPFHIEQVLDEEVLLFLERFLYLVPLNEREPDYNVLERTTINHARALLFSEHTQL